MNKILYWELIMEKTSHLLVPYYREEKMAGTTLVEKEGTDETESEDRAPLAKKSP